MGDDVAAILLEPVQGEGGVHLAQAAFLWEARNLCDRHGALLIVDEVQTGMGRTGSLFACDIFGLKPDLLCLAKSLAGGFPMGAVLVDKRIEVAVGLHGSTFGGNPVACAAGRAALEVIRDEDLADQARDNLNTQVDLRLLSSTRSPNTASSPCRRVRPWCASCRRWSSAMKNWTRSRRPSWPPCHKAGLTL